MQCEMLNSLDGFKKNLDTKDKRKISEFENSVIENRMTNDHREKRIKMESSAT